MSQLTTLRNKIQVKIFDKVATTGSIQPVASSTTDKWGDGTRTYASSTTLKIVPYNFFSTRGVHEPFGDLAERETDAVIPYDTTFTRWAKVTFNNDEFVIRDIEEFLYASDGSPLAYAIRLVKNHD